MLAKNEAGFIDTVHIKWYGMYSINDFYNREEAFKKGLFAISRVYAKNVTLLYIGQTKRSFIQKISELNKEWAFDESELKITLGIIEFPSGELYSEKKVKEITSLLILRH
ncbi:sodium:proton symporter, partial [Bacillus cereus]